MLTFKSVHRYHEATLISHKGIHCSDVFIFNLVQFNIITESVPILKMEPVKMETYNTKLYFSRDNIIYVLIYTRKKTLRLHYQYPYV